MQEKKEKYSFLKKDKRKVSSVYLIFLLSYLVLLVITLSSAFIYYGEINRHTTRAAETSKVNLLSHLKLKNDDNLDVLGQFANNLAFSSKILSVAKGNTLYSTTDIKLELASKIKPAEHVIDYFIYIEKTEEIITPTLSMNARDFFQVMYSFEDMDYEEIKSTYLNEGQYHQLFPSINVKLGGANTVEAIPYIQSFPVTSGREPLGQIIILLDEQKLFSPIKELATTSGSILTVVDLDKNIVYSSDVAADIQIKEIIENESSTVKKNGYISTKVTSGNSPWTFIISTHESIYFKNRTEAIRFFAVIFTAYFLLGLVIVWLLAKRSYKPIQEIHSLAFGVGVGKSLDMGNELDVIKKTLEYQIHNDKQLNDVISDHLPIIRRDFFVQLLKGLITSDEEIAERTEMIGFNYESDNFYVLLIECETDSPFVIDSEISQERNLSLTRIVIQNIGTELLQEKFRCFFVEINRNQNAMILNLPKETEASLAKNIIAEKMEELIRICSEKFFLYISVSVSKRHTSLKNVAVGFDEATKALSQTKIMDNNKPKFFEDISAKGEDYYFPTDIEYQLVDDLRKGKANAAKELLNYIIEVNSTHKNLSKQTAKAFIYALAATMENVAKNICISRNLEEKITLFPIEKEDIIDQYKNAKDTLPLLYSAVDTLTQITSLGTISKTEKLVERITKFIDQKAGEEWVDLNILSEEVGVTPQYISAIFKKHKDENVKDYISKKVLEKAKYLLETTDLPVKEIAVQVGYANEVSIIRLFKKYEKMTPGDYRLMSQKSNPN